MPKASTNGVEKLKQTIKYHILLHGHLEQQQKHGPRTVRNNAWDKVLALGQTYWIEAWWCSGYNALIQ